MRQKMRDLADEPRPPHRGTADHHGIGAGLRQHRSGVREARTIAIRGHGYRNGFLDLADRRPVCPARIKLAARTAMNAEHGDPFGLRQPREFRRIDRLIIPAKPHFQCHGDAHGRDGGANKRHRQRDVAHQMRSGIAVRDFFSGTAHVDVNDRSPRILREPRRFRHNIRIAAGDLNHVEAAAVSRGFHQIGGIPAGEMICRDHLGDGKRGSKPVREPPHADVRHPCHGCQKRASRKLGAADLERSASTIA